VCEDTGEENQVKCRRKRKRRRVLRALETMS